MSEPTAFARIAKYTDNPSSIRATVRTDDLRELLLAVVALKVRNEELKRMVDAGLKHGSELTREAMRSHLQGGR
jgi:hypothetical protein